ncbi:MAG: hypothetical protein H7098_09095 [Oligoflexus sp.]|nr:hypothetical protein [Pseudopedobacter sp.]
MKSLVIYPNTQDQLKALIKSWNISSEKYLYDLIFVKEIKEREKSIKEGNTIPIKDSNNIWERIL